MESARNTIRVIFATMIMGAIGLLLLANLSGGLGLSGLQETLTLQADVLTLETLDLTGLLGLSLDQEDSLLSLGLELLDSELHLATLLS